ncbi:MAG TPA: GTPase ObgE [Jeotgalicoccus sp.]|uniref:GTPase Obg n=1 Tax=Phocicoccus schoeneichii TaxID=1812261 RepID=A0A6V7RGE4_9BACL|nr:GTPase ObgE [Jeotgalicoccus schoeneichii]GGH48670.1 GTPase Obg [Jeotgalicoccus schoeneichii]CAD2076619.1 GTPase Obg [Jeotgalicoccus schoeneichii]HLR38996.1 GTPase ObgE [Jeotgalicoccus sp.]
MFVDYVKIHLKAGNGGNGLVAYRREKYVPMGGPAGGDGGNGADIVMQVDEGLRTLMDFRFQSHFKAEHGENGMNANKHGKSRDALILKVPPGTIVKDAESGAPIADLTTDGQTAVIAKGGRGGRGNSRFVSSRNTAPDFAEGGEPGQEVEVILELKLMADVGLVGFPSVGKSTLLSRVSRAEPKIAAYPFTTIKPNLGVVNTKDGRSFVMADLPGLIEGASEGTGLGHQFLRHVERTKVLVHVIDIAETEFRDAVEDYNTIRNEMKLYNESLLSRPEIIALNKIEILSDDETLEKFKREVDTDSKIMQISAVTGQGIDELLYEIADTLDNYEEQEEVEIDDSDIRVVYKHEKDRDQFEISRDMDGTFVVSGEGIERLFMMTDFSRDSAVRRFARQMRSMGIDEALRKRGIKTGEIVRIMDFEFEFVE